jgi:hypothetical protein
MRKKVFRLEVSDQCGSKTRRKISRTLSRRFVGLSPLK